MSLIRQVTADAIEVVRGMISRLQQRVHLFVLDCARVVFVRRRQVNLVAVLIPQSRGPLSITVDAVRGEVELNRREIPAHPTARLDLIPERAQDWTVVGNSLVKARDIDAVASGKCEDQCKALQSVSSGVPDIDDTRLPKVTP